MFFDFLIWNYKDAQFVEILIRINSIFWFSTAFWMLNFAHSFLQKKRDLVFYLLAFGTGITILISLFTKWIIVGKHRYFWGADIEHGPLFFASTMAIITIPALYVMWLFFVEHQQTDETSRKKQLVLLIAGTISLLIFGMVSDVLLPIFTNQTDHLRLASSVALGQVTCIGIATLKYGFLNFDVDEASFRYFQESNDAVIGIDFSGKILFSNPAANRLFDKPKLRNKSIIDFIEDYSVEKNYSTYWTKLSESSNIDICITQSEVLHAGSKIGKIIIIRDVSELAQTQENFRRLSMQTQAMVEEERKSIAREIHDELGQILTGIKMDIKWLQSKLPSPHKMPVEYRFESIENLVDTAIQTTRRISAELRPGILDDLGLIPAIEWYVDEFKKRSELQFDLNLPDEDIEISQDIATVVFRILQETLTNVVRHANAKKVEILLEDYGEKIKFFINDDGIGYDNLQPTKVKSIGILGMTERAKMCGGALEIVGKQGVGTKIKLTIPKKKGGEYLYK